LGPSQVKTNSFSKNNGLDATIPADLTWVTRQDLSDMSKLSHNHLYLFFTRGTPLTAWHNGGTLAREARTYQELKKHLAGIDFVTYGGPEDLELAGELRGLHLRANRWGLHPRLYAPLLAHLLPRFWPKPAIFKSNQVKGAEIMLAAARAAGARSIARAGYLPSNIEAWAHGSDSAPARAMRALEENVFQGADRVVVTTRDMADTVSSRYGVVGSKLRIIPNYVDTDLFKPAPSRSGSKRLVFVGRLHPEKNLESLFSALKGLDLELELIGEGDLRPLLEERAQSENLDVRFLGPKPNRELPQHINGATAFIFPSLGEHHPKSLIEAMSCGAAVIACDVPGVRDLIEHGHTGWLCGTSPQELRQAMVTVLADQELRNRLGKAAHEYCLDHFALNRVVSLELDLLREMTE
jgi:glycosyltransferase involved in cell wall biosynthesis